MKLYPYQETCVNFHLSRKYSLNLCQMGLGKSFIALETARRLGHAPLIFGPAFLEGTWRNESTKAGVPIAGYVSYAMLHKLNPSVLQSSRFWVAEECHYLKSPAAIRTQTFFNAVREYRPERLIGLTGTPIKNRVPDLWSLLMLMDMGGDVEGMLPPGLRFHRKFSRHFCHVEEMRIHGRLVEKYKDIRESRVEEFRALLRPKAIRFLASDVLKDLPPIIRKEVPIPTAEAPDGLESTFNDYMAGKKIDSASKRISAVIKVPATVEYCKALMESGSGKLVVFTDHIEPAKDIATRLGDRAVAITGGTPAWERQAVVNEFQTSASRHMVIVATIGSMSTGFTLTAARNVIFNDLSWVPSDNLQAEKRIHRIGQKHPCIVHYIDSTPTDAYIRKTLLEKMDTIDKAIK